MLNLIRIVRNLNGQVPNGGEDSEYYVGFDAGKSATIDSVLRMIEYIVENKEVEF